MRFTYDTVDTCAKRITFELDGDIVHNVQFMGGCQGNLTAISRLVEGRSVDELAMLLGHVRCGNKRTSCAHQLVSGVWAAREKARELKPKLALL